MERSVFGREKEIGRPRTRGAARKQALAVLMFGGFGDMACGNAFNRRRRVSGEAPWPGCGRDGEEWECGSGRGIA